MIRANGIRDSLKDGGIIHLTTAALLLEREKMCFHTNIDSLASLHSYVNGKIDLNIDS